MARKLNTKITEMLGIEYPILLGAMQGLTNAEFVAAVSNAGGLGVMRGDPEVQIPHRQALRRQPDASAFPGQF